MTISTSLESKTLKLAGAGLGKLFEALRTAGYRLVGPTVRKGAVVFDEIDSPEDLPAGYVDEQSAGRYRLNKTDSPAMFGCVNGPDSAKRFLFPPERTLFRTIRTGPKIAILPERIAPPKTALLGLRACDLAAIAIQDKVFLDSAHRDTYYAAAREVTLLIAVECGRANPTCFCTSMNTGPAVIDGFDLCLTELVEPEHCFVVRAGSPLGEVILAGLHGETADDEVLAAAAEVPREAARQISKSLDRDDLKDILYRTAESGYWQSIGERCFACGSCTQVCPTCFCHSVRESSSLDGKETARTRVWDSCFNEDFSYIHGGSVRSGHCSRYRQWLTHKFAAWIDQFGTEGCVGCGRCITWCPAGIDIADEAAALRRQDLASTSVRS